MAIRAIKKVDINGKAINKHAVWKKLNPGQIYFDSKFEWQCYKELKKAKFFFEKHPERRELVPAFNSLALSGGKSARKLFPSKVRPLTYTTDFAVYCNNGTTIFIEAKGFFHPDARIRYKLFQASMKTNEISVLVMQKNGLQDMKGLIKIINEDFGGSTGVKVKKKERNNTNLDSI
tara:strand:+ start:966 stop:1493 length:528 start_codon:yes stop_codon:yes gene_type:complete